MNTALGCNDALFCDVIDDVESSHQLVGFGQSPVLEDDITVGQFANCLRVAFVRFPAVADTDAKRTRFRAKADTSPEEGGQCFDRKRTKRGEARNGVRDRS